MRNRLTLLSSALTLVALSGVLLHDEDVNGLGLHLGLLLLPQGKDPLSEVRPAGPALKQGRT